MTHFTLEEDGDSKDGLDALTNWIMEFNCGGPKVAKEDAKELATWILERWKENDIESFLKWTQEERKIEQSYFSQFMTTWFLICTPFMAASAYALTLASHPNRLWYMSLCASIITILSLGFRYSISSSMQAQNHRHLQLVLLTSVSRKYRPWGFNWRLEDGKDKTHRRTFAYMGAAIWVIICASWLFCALAWATG